ncbi:MAG: hypothetical protein JWQ96_1520 [Segetibacter sp.]|nr:hypothetical protein [Segetibacter sp.]
MKRFFQYLLLAVFIFSPGPAKSQGLPKGIKNFHFFAQPVYSQGAPRETVYLDGTTKLENSNEPSYQYFLYLLTNSKKLKITSVVIDKVRYNFQLKKVTTPVLVENGNKDGKNLQLVKQSTYPTFQLTSMRRVEALRENQNIKHCLVIRGSVDGKSFLIRSSATLLDPSVAQ